MMSRVVLAALFFGTVRTVPISKPAAPSLASGTARAGLRGSNNTIAAAKVPHALNADMAAHHTNRTTDSSPPCACEAMRNSWKACSRTVPRCVFIDLGAANGNSFRFFEANGFGPVGNCPSKQWKAVLVEANPAFDHALKELSSGFSNDQMEVAASTAAYMCEAETTFFLDTINRQTNYWGSSMSSHHPDTQRSGLQKVTVPTRNLMRILYEETIPGDWVMVKMDIEGAEYDILPCLAVSPAASLIDRLYLEEHQVSWGNAGTSSEAMQNAKVVLKQRGVDIPPYFSWTL